MKHSFSMVWVMLWIGFFAVHALGATQRHWTGAGANSNASTAANWLEGAPVAGDDIVLDASTNKFMTWDTNAPASVGSWTQVGYLGTVTVATVYGTNGFTNFTIVGNCIISNGGWTHTVNAGTEQYRLYVTIGGNLVVGPAGRIDANAKGSTLGTGTGINNTKASSYGGQGGIEGGANLPPGISSVVPAPTYGSMTSPTNVGSGGFGFCGGGAIRLAVSGTTTLDGSIWANGSPRDGHCTESGGSVWLTTGSLTGTGKVNACGGVIVSTATCGGGGGRIALIVTNAAADFSGFTGLISAAAGKGGAAGTIYREKPADAGRGELIVDNNLVWSPAYIATRFGGTAAMTCDFSRIVLTNAGNLGLFGADSLVLTNTAIVGGPGPATNCGGISLYGVSLALPSTYAWSNYFIRIHTNAGSSVSCEDITVGTNAMLIVDQPYLFSNVTIKAGGLLRHDGNFDSEKLRLNVTVISNLTVDAGGAIDVSRRGYGTGKGPAPGPNGGGSSHGGQGKFGPAVTYGSLVAPTNLGSGSNPNQGYDKDWGGGAAILAVGGTTTLNGSMVAEGGPRDGNGGAAGGSLFLTTGRLTGSGTISAKGGGNSPGGGGGRIALVLTNAAASFTEFTGPITASGQGTGPGGAGTVYLRAPGQGTNEGTLIVDNNALSATVGALITTSVTDTAVGDVVIRSNGVLQLALNQSLTVGGMWSNAATFNAITGSTIYIAGSETSTSTVYGTSVFYRLTCTTPGKTVKFAAASSNVVREALTFTGASGSNIVLRSTVDGTQWKLAVSNAAIQSVSYVDVKDSDARPGATISPSYSTNSGNNSNWSFAVTGQTNIWLGTNSAMWGTPGNWSLERIPTLSDTKAVIPAGCSNYPVLDTIREVNGLDLDVGASLTLSGYDFTINGNANLAGSLRATGTESLRFLGGLMDFAGGGTITPAASTLIIGGAGAQTVNLAGKTYWNLWVTNGAGLVTLNGGCTAKQFWFNGGTNPVSVNFGAGVPFNLRDFEMLGSASLTNITLRSASSPSAWLLNVSGYSRVLGVDVKDSDAGGGKPIYPMSSKDSGSNSNWVFEGSWSTWLGTHSTSFTNPANWSPVGAPNASSLILVETNNALIIGTTTTVQTLILGGGTGAVQVQVFAPLTVSGDVTVRTNATLWINQPMTVSNDFIVQAGGMLTHTSNVSSDTYKLTLTVSSNLFLDAGAEVNVNRKGYSATYGPGGSADDSYAASYGGEGGKGAGMAGRPTYGSVLAPTNLGSGCRGWSAAGDLERGGEAVILSVGGITTINGLMTAEGGPRDGNRSAAGGTFFLTTGQLLGSGSIKAQGGIANSAAGGGGGRIAVVLLNPAGSFTNFSGSMTVSGQGTLPGGAGTIYLQGPGQGAGRGDVIVNNGGQNATSLNILPPALWSVPDELRYARLLITNNSTRVTLSNNMTVANLYVYTNAILNLTNFNLSVNTTRHDLGGGTTNSAGGQIIWLGNGGTVFLFY